MTSHLPAFDVSRLRTSYPEAGRERAALLALARAGLQAERWEDVMRVAKELVRAVQQATPGADLTAEERHIFFTASKQVQARDSDSEQPAGLNRIAASASAPLRPLLAHCRDRVASLAVLSAVICLAVAQVLSGIRAAWRNSKVEDGGVRDVTDEYKVHLERELHATAVELAALLEGSLLKSVMSPEPQIFYRKLCGDFYRYLAEVSVPGAAGQCDAAGKDDAGHWLRPTNPRREGRAGARMMRRPSIAVELLPLQAGPLRGSPLRLVALAAERSTRALGCRSVHSAISIAVISILPSICCSPSLRQPCRRAGGSPRRGRVGFERGAAGLREEVA